MFLKELYLISPTIPFFCRNIPSFLVYYDYSHFAVCVISTVWRYFVVDNVSLLKKVSNNANFSLDPLPPTNTACLPHAQAEHGVYYFFNLLFLNDPCILKWMHRAPASFQRAQCSTWSRVVLLAFVINNLCNSITEN